VAVDDERPGLVRSKHLHPASHPSPAVLLGVALALCLVTRIYFLVALPYCAEDAYITFRYALNWAHGLGPSYNAGERYWGFTSPLWTTCLAVIAYLGIPIETGARVMLVVCDLLIVWLGWRLLARESLAAAIGFSLFFAVWPRLAQMPASGLESSLVTCLLLATASLATSRAGGALNGLLALSRPEGAAMSVLMSKLLRRPQRLVWIAVAMLIGLFMLHFGRLLPSSVASKASVYGVQLLKGVYWMEWLVPGMAPQTEDGMALAPISVLLLAGLVAALVRWRRRPPEGSPLPSLLACGVLTLFTYLVLGVPWYFWYAPTPTVAVLVAVFFGLGSERLLRWLWVPLVVVVMFSWLATTPRIVRRQTHDAAVFASIGETLRRDAAERPSTVMLEPIGIIGYMSGLRVIDEVGLVTPWVAEERRKGDGWYARVIARDRPDYIVIRRDWLAGGIEWAGAGNPFVSRAQAARVLSDYHPLQFRTSLPEGAGKLVILKRDARRRD
jgi:hypothetical protein